jgi:hypothetical protein
MLNRTMAKSTNIVKRKAGRPIEIGAGATEFVGLRLPTDLCEAIDAWSKANAVRGRSAAIRRLVEVGLGASRRSTPGKVSDTEVRRRLAFLLHQLASGALTGKELAGARKIAALLGVKI